MKVKVWLLPSAAQTTGDVLCVCVRVRAIVYPPKLSQINSLFDKFFRYQQNLKTVRKISDLFA
uniref:Uncharacterized protein n=1 Tax=Anguilla anguilla TaxID=7936 RepID=A0A0E9QHZ6_ANGAN